MPCSEGLPCGWVILANFHVRIAKGDVLHVVTLNSKYFKLLRPTATRLVNRCESMPLLTGCYLLCLEAIADTLHNIFQGNPALAVRRIPALELAGAFGKRPLSVVVSYRSVWSGIHADLTIAAFCTLP